MEIDTSAEYCKKACDMTLEALGTDYIDLCKFFNLKRKASILDKILTMIFVDYVHNVDTKTPIEETMRALAELQA